MREGYFDREGAQISRETWSALIADHEYKRVALAELPDGRCVSTIWLGSDHNFGPSGDMLLFETMVLDKESGARETRRYSTLEEAQRGHAEVVARWKKQGPWRDADVDKPDTPGWYPTTVYFEEQVGPIPSAAYWNGAAWRASTDAWIDTAAVSRWLDECCDDAREAACRASDVFDGVVQ